ncbi:MAG: hypothetical protein ACJAZO_003965 [Myxococcota bacterium]|jgi:hypothetical protein
MMTFLLMGLAAHAQVVVEPDQFAIGSTWAAEAELALPDSQGACMFTEDGTEMYAVGRAEESESQLFSLSVTRDPGNHRVTAFGQAVSLFGGTESGLDSGLVVGPEGTLFYTYWSSNHLGIRPGGVTGAETIYNMADYNVDESIAGLTISPYLNDPATNFGMFQFTVYDTDSMWNLPLIPLGNGIFEPGTPELWADNIPSGPGAIGYMPVGAHAGDLLIAEYGNDAMSVIQVDPATGYAIDASTGLPTLGTDNPQSFALITELNGPWGLCFDSVTQDLYITEYGSGGRIMQVLATGACDTDADGFRNIECGGDDCDDNDELIVPTSIVCLPDFDDDGDPDVTDPDDDNDGVTDEDEATNGTNPMDTDTDDDGVPDGVEVANNSDGTLPDTDDDGLTDAQEIEEQTNPRNPDTDGDGITDGDEVNTGTDPLVAEDGDDDGLPDHVEADLGTNPEVADTDGDGITDGDEVNTGTDPLVAEDGDDDGLPDHVEADLGTNPEVADTDGDGITDGDEVNTGTDPLDPLDPNDADSIDDAVAGGCSCDNTSSAGWTLMPLVGLLLIRRRRSSRRGIDSQRR